MYFCVVNFIEIRFEIFVFQSVYERIKNVVSVSVKLICDGNVMEIFVIIVIFKVYLKLKGLIWKCVDCKYDYDNDEYFC